MPFGQFLSEFFFYKLDGHLVQSNQTKNDLIFDTKIEIDVSPIILEDINYNKKKNIYSELKFNGQIFENKNIKFENIKLLESQNNL